MRENSFKIIHTSDWHLGQHFMGKSRQVEHQKFLDWLIALAVEQQVNAIIVAGDIFDTGSPPSYARQLYNQFIVKLQATGVQLIILGGNHDSVAMLGESKELLACLNSHVIPGALANIEEQVIELNAANNQPQAIVCAIPYLRPRDIVLSEAGQSGKDKQEALKAAISEHYHSIYKLAKSRQTEIQQEFGRLVPIIATGHLTTVGSKSSESVRDIYIGTLEAFPSSGFPPADYIALGHIHRPQLVGGAEHIRYCGSPIPLSFDELNNDKTVLVVDFNNGKFERAIANEVPRFQPMHLVKGDLGDIEAAIKTLAKQYDESLPAWLDIEVSTQDYLSDLQKRIELIVEELPLEVLLLRREKIQRLQSIESVNRETLQELNPNDVFERRLSSENWEGEAQAAKRIRVTEIFNQVLHDIKEEGES